MIRQGKLDCCIAPTFQPVIGSIRFRVVPESELQIQFSAFSDLGGLRLAGRALNLYPSR